MKLTGERTTMPKLPYSYGVSPTHIVSLARHFVFGLLLIALINMGATLPASAATQSPKTLLEDTTHKMISAIKGRRAEIKKNPKIVKEIIENILLPHIDIISASRWVLGKNWRRAEKQQKLGFIKEFRTLLLRFYSTALVEYLSNHDIDESVITFLPLRAGADEKDVTVRSRVRSPNGKTISVNYHMHLTKKGWKIYDVAIEGVSIITTYRTSFAAEIRKKGIDGLISSLSERNHKLQLSATNTPATK